MSHIEFMCASKIKNLAQSLKIDARSNREHAGKGGRQSLYGFFPVLNIFEPCNQRWPLSETTGVRR